MVRLLRVALLLVAVAATLSGCSSGSGSGSPIQGGGNGSGDAAPGDSQNSGSGGGGGLAGGPPSGGGGGASAGGGSLGAYDPVGAPLRCLRRQKVHAYRAAGAIIQVAPKPTGPRVVFTSTQGDAQAAQIHGQAEGAEVIGAALLYVNDASDGLIKVMENCLDASGGSK